MSILLAIDTSTQMMGLALFDGSQVIAESTWRSHGRHTVELAPSVQALLGHCGLKPVDLAVIACAIGPGSFTSLRIGLAFAKGLTLARNLPLLGIPTLDILTAAQPPADIPLVVVLQAGRYRLAAAWYNCQDGKWTSVEDPAVMTVAELHKRIHVPTLVAGELDEEARKELKRKWKNVRLVPPAQCLRRPGYLAALAWERWINGEVDDPVSLSPIYLRTRDPIPDV